VGFKPHQVSLAAVVVVVVVVTDMMMLHQVEWKGKEHLQLLAKASDNYRKALHYECSKCHTHMYPAPLLRCKAVTPSTCTRTRAPPSACSCCPRALCPQPATI
jgi:hypothetical protein